MACDKKVFNFFLYPALKILVAFDECQIPGTTHLNELSWELQIKGWGNDLWLHTHIHMHTAHLRILTIHMLIYCHLKEVKQITVRDWRWRKTAMWSKIHSKPIILEKEMSWVIFEGVQRFLSEDGEGHSMHVEGLKTKIWKGTEEAVLKYAM